jgi:adenylate cyclase class 2
VRLAGKSGLRKSGDSASGRTHRETEVKLRVPDKRRFLRQLARMRAKLTRGRVHEMNTLYDTARGDLIGRGEMLRLRVESPAADANSAGPRGAGGEELENAAWLTFKGPVMAASSNKRKRYKVREEHEVPISDAKEMPKILEALGLRPSFRYEKFRTTYELPRVSRLKVVLDETPIGLFVELEGASEQIDRAAKLLGFGASDYISKSYGALFMDACGVKAARRGARVEPRPASRLPDMLFRS